MLIAFDSSCSYSIFSHQKCKIMRVGMQSCYFRWAHLPFGLVGSQTWAALRTNEPRTSERRCPVVDGHGDQWWTQELSGHWSQLLDAVHIPRLQGIQCTEHGLHLLPLGLFRERYRSAGWERLQVGNQICCRTDNSMLNIPPHEILALHSLHTVSQCSHFSFGGGGTIILMLKV